MQRLFPPNLASFRTHCPGLSRTNQPSVRATLVCVVALALLFASALPAFAQATTQPPTTQDIANLSSESPATARRSYNTIRNYFKDTDLGAIDRSSAGKSLLPELERLITDPESSQIVYVPMIFIVGDIATEEATTLLNTLRTHDNVAIRFPAVIAMGNTIASATGDGAPAIGQRQMLRIVDWLGTTIETDVSPNVVRVAMDALFKGRNVDADGFDSIKPTALARIAESTSVRLGQIEGSGPTDLAIIEASVNIGQRLRNLMLTDRDMDDTLIKKIAGTGGDIVSAINRMLRKNAIPMLDASTLPADAQLRERVASAATLGVNLIFVARDALSRGSVVNQPDLGVEIAKGTTSGDAAYTKAFRTLVGDVLTKPPFSFASDRFIR